MERNSPELLSSGVVALIKAEHPGATQTGGTP